MVSVARGATGAVADSAAETDEAILVAICRREYAPLVAMLSLYCGDPQEAEDLAQEALIRLSGRWGHEQIDSPAAWLRRVAFNLSASRGRRITALRRATGRAALERDLPPEADAAEALAVRTAVRALPARQRQALVLRYYADLSVAETAAEMGCPEGTVKTLTRQAISALRTNGLEVTEDD